MNLNTILRELALFVEPLFKASTSLENFSSFVNELGYEFPSGNGQDFFDAITMVTESAGTLFGNTDDNAELDPEDLRELINSLRNFTNLGLNKKEGPADFFVDVLNYLLLKYLARGKLFIYSVLVALGVAEQQLITVNATSERFFQVKFYWDRLKTLFQDVGQWSKEVYGWGGDGNLPDESSLDYELLLNNFILLLEATGYIFAYTENVPAAEIPSSISNWPAGRQLLRAYLPLWQTDALGADPNGVPVYGVETGVRFLPYGNFNDPTNLGFSLAPYLKGNIVEDVEITDNLRVEIRVSAEVDGGLVLVVRPNEISNEASVNASAGLSVFLKYANFTDGGPVNIVDEAALKISLEEAKIGGGGDTNGEFFVSAGVSGLVFKFDFSDAGLLSNFISEPFDVTLGQLGVSWRYGRGLTFEGGNSLEVALPLHIDFGVFKITRGAIAIGLTEPSTQIAIDCSLNLGAVAMSVESVGLKATFPEAPNGLLGNRDISLRFKPPNGIGIAVNAGVVKGGGYLFFDFEREEYAGALELVFSEWIALKAIGLITTRMPDGSKGFSMVIIITAEFGQGIQLGMGFTLLGVGGILGLNRVVNIDALSSGVRSGGIESVLFPQNVVANAPRIISDLRQYFPVQEGQFLIGPMAKIGYGTPTLISLSLGVIIEFPDVNITILGVLKMALPDEEAAILKLQVNFLGRIEPSNKRLWFYAELFDSRLLTLTLEGGMGILVSWGSDANFVFTVGGFHPKYDPPSLPFPEPPRLAISLLNQSMARIRIEAYFAVTSNTAQFGSRAEVYFGFSALRVEGHLSFDALFQFDPFYFIFEFSIKLSVKVFGFGLYNISVSGLLEGPTKWHIKGKAKWKITWLGPTIKINIDETWGQDTQTPLPPIPVMPIIEREFAAITNWQAVLPAGTSLRVSFRSPEDSTDTNAGNGAPDTRPLIFHPGGFIRISQSKVPLMPIDKLGNQKPSDANDFSISVQITGGTQLSVTDARERFATGEFKNLDKSKRLSSPGFEHFISGGELRAQGDQLRTSLAVKRIMRYETVIIDNNFKQHIFQFFVQLVASFQVLTASLFGHFAQGSAITTSVLSANYKRRVQPQQTTIKVLPHQYTVANLSDNAPVTDADGINTAAFGSQTEALNYLQKRAEANPTEAADFHVVPSTEANFATAQPNTL